VLRLGLRIGLGLGLVTVVDETEVRRRRGSRLGLWLGRCADYLRESNDELKLDNFKTK
jgi:hypothetical protein